MPDAPQMSVTVHEEPLTEAFTAPILADHLATQRRCGGLHKLEALTAQMLPSAPAAVALAADDGPSRA